MKHFLFILLFFLPDIGKAQQLSKEEQRQVDSLNLLIRAGTPDTAVASAYVLLSELLYGVYPDTLLPLSEKAEQYAREKLSSADIGPAAKRSLQSSLAAALNNIGYLHKTQGRMEMAIDYYSRALTIWLELGKKSETATLLGNIGSLNHVQGNMPVALEYYLKGLKIYEELDDKSGIAYAYNNIAQVYNELHDTTKALTYLLQSLRMKEMLGDKRGMTTTLFNIGMTYSYMEQHAIALHYQLKALKLAKELGNRRETAFALYGIGGVYKDRGDMEQARKYNLEALALFEECRDPSSMAMACIALTGITYSLGDQELSEHYGKKALALAREAKSIHQEELASATLYKYYKKSGRHKDALEMYMLSVEINDSISGQENQKALLRQDMQYQYDKKKALDEKAHEKQVAITKAREQQQRVVSYTVAGGFALVLLFTMVAFNRLRITRKQKQMIELQKQIVEEKQKEILDSISYAKRLQEAILPPAQLVRSQLPGSFILYKPKDIVAGDFYWMESMKIPGEGKEEELLFIAAADCTGHGVPGAMVSVVCSNALNRAVLEFGISEPGKILDKTKELVLETFSKSEQDVKDGMDISLVSINRRSLEVKWAGAYNPLWYIHKEEMCEIRPDKQAIGRTERSAPFITHRLLLEKGDSLFLFTDGFADQFGGDLGKKFKYKPLKELLHQHAAHSPEEQKEILENTFESWRGDMEQVDDVCIIGIRL